jgi:hypothetical protein
MPQSFHDIIMGVIFEVHFIGEDDNKKCWCLIHNSHLGKILNFCKILDLKLAHLREVFDKSFHLISTIAFLATIILYPKIMCITYKKISKTYVKTASERCD